MTTRTHAPTWLATVHCHTQGHAHEVALMDWMPMQAVLFPGHLPNDTDDDGTLCWDCPTWDCDGQVYWTPTDWTGAGS